MKITIELDNFIEIKQLLTFLKEIGIDSFKVVEKEGGMTEEQIISKGDKSIDPSELFGLWENDHNSIENIRKEGWERIFPLSRDSNSSNIQPIN